MVLIFVHFYCCCFHFPHYLHRVFLICKLFFFFFYPLLFVSSIHFVCVCVFLVLFVSLLPFLFLSILLYCILLLLSHHPLFSLYPSIYPSFSSPHCILFIASLLILFLLWHSYFLFLPFFSSLLLLMHLLLLLLFHLVCICLLLLSSCFLKCHHKCSVCVCVGNILSAAVALKYVWTSPEFVFKLSMVSELVPTVLWWSVPPRPCLHHRPGWSVHSWHQRPSSWSGAMAGARIWLPIRWRWKRKMESQ